MFPGFGFYKFIKFFIPILKVGLKWRKYEFSSQNACF